SQAVQRIGAAHDREAAVPRLVEQGAALPLTRFRTLLEDGSAATEGDARRADEELLRNRSRSTAFQRVTGTPPGRLVGARTAALADVRVLCGRRCVLDRCCRDVAGG